MRDIRLTLFISGYWFSGGYLATWFTPYALECGLGSIAIGLALLRVTRLYEDRGAKTPFLLGCALFAPPLTMALVGGAWLMLSLLGLGP